LAVDDDVSTTLMAHDDPSRTSEVIAFLAGSPNRREILARLEAGPATREALLADVDASRVTLWRNLSELVDRDWVSAEEDGYSLTVAGRLVFEHFRSLQRTLDTVERLGDVVEWLPAEEMGVDVARLADARIAVPTPSDPQAPMRLVDRQMREASHVDILSHAMAPNILGALDADRDGDDLVVEGVITSDVADAIGADPRTHRQFRDAVARGALRWHRYDGEIPYVLAVLDGERVGIGLDDDAGRPQAVLETDDPVVLEWALETFDAYRRDAHPM